MKLLAPLQEKFRPAPPSVRRWIWRLLTGAVVLIAFVFGYFLLISPSANSAVTLARRLAADHGIHPDSVPPEKFTRALTATEDRRFWSVIDPGIDVVAIGRVVFGRLAGFPDQGGSTIDQQLAKMLYSPQQHGLWVELERMAIALKLNAVYSKAEILAMYAEVAYYGHGYYGLWAASCGYFGKRPAEMTWPESAMLAGVVNAPSMDDPVSNLPHAYNRMKHVLDRLVAVGYLTSGEADAAKSQPLDLTENRPGVVDAACNDPTAGRQNNGVIAHVRSNSAR